MIGFPFRIMPFVWTALISAGLVGLWWAVDEIGDRREAKVRAEYAEAVAAAQDQARKDADAAVEARLPAALPGAALRLRQHWCSNCPEAR